MLPSSVSGIGTKYYGKRDVEPDGSYITTLWIIILWVPLIPLASYRILLVSGSEMHQEYVVRRVPFSYIQVAKIYGLIVLFLAVGLGLSYLLVTLFD